MYNNLCLQVGTTAGATIEEAMTNLVDASKRFDMAVTTKFNGCELTATPTTNPQKLVDYYETWRHLVKN